MLNIDSIEVYLDFCKKNKRLNDKTLKAYRIDLLQFMFEFDSKNYSYTADFIEEYFGKLSLKYKPSTSKRKYAALKAYFNYLEYKNIIEYNPFSKLRLSMQEELILPKIFSIDILNSILKAAYFNLDACRQNNFHYFFKLCSVTVLELLFSTGIRVSELCNLKMNSVDIKSGNILIMGKGAKERIICIQNEEVLSILNLYITNRRALPNALECLFVNRIGNRLSEQSVRNIITRTLKDAGLNMHITPHMFRHTLATSLLDRGVDCRHIQKILGHSSITTTERYTHVSLEMQKSILKQKHPRNILHFM